MITVFCTVNLANNICSQVNKAKYVEGEIALNNKLTSFLLQIKSNQKQVSITNLKQFQFILIFLLSNILYLTSNF